MIVIPPTHIGNSAVAWLAQWEPVLARIAASGKEPKRFDCQADGTTIVEFEGDECPVS